LKWMTEGVSAPRGTGAVDTTMIWTPVHSLLSLMLNEAMVQVTHDHSRREEAAQDDNLDGIVEG
jgi:hypothetical protein